MKPAARHAVILEFINERKQRGDSCGVNVLYSDFVDWYIEKTNAKYGIQFFGAFSCPQLGRDLSAMYKAGLLKRHTESLAPGDAAMGFPKWIYTYTINEVTNETSLSRIDQTISTGIRRT
jgi:hypothetical protein